MSGMLTSDSATLHPKVQAAREMADRIRDRGSEISEARQVPADLMREFFDKGLLHLLRPAKYGGPELSLKTTYEVARELARGDASVGWVHTVVVTHEHILAHFPEEVQEEYWASSEYALCASSYIPSGKVTPVDGGYRLTGQWSFCSGVDHVNWIVVGAIAGMIPGDQPKPDMRYFLVPASDFKIIDDWHVMGLRGTGSKSVAIDDVFVPANRVVTDADMRTAKAPGALSNPNNAFRYSPFSLLAFSLSGLAPSIARNAYNTVLEQFRSRGSKPDPLFDMRRPAVALQLAKTSAMIDAVDLLYMRALNETFAIVEAGGELTIEQRVQNRRDQCYAVDQAREAGHILMGMGGGRNIREGGVVQRAHRDLCALSVHPGTMWEATALSYGSVALGGQPTEYYF